MLRVRTAWSGSAQSLPYVTTMYFGGITQAEADAAAAGVRAFWDAIKGRVSSTLIATVEPEVPLVNITTGDVTDVFATVTTPVTGTDVGSALPWATQGLLRLSTATFVGGRRVKGHVFIPGTTENSNAGGVPEAVYGTTINPAAATLAAIAFPNEWVVYSRRHLLTANVATATTATQWGTLSSRRQL